MRGPFARSIWMDFFIISVREMKILSDLISSIRRIHLVVRWEKEMCAPQQQNWINMRHARRMCHLLSFQSYHLCSSIRPFDNPKCLLFIPHVNQMDRVSKIYLLLLTTKMFNTATNTATAKIAIGCVNFRVHFFLHPVIHYVFFFFVTQMELLVKSLPTPWNGISISEMILDVWN